MRAWFLLVAVVAAVLWRAPAGLVGLAAHRGMGEVRLTGTEGTLWRGQGMVELLDQPTQTWQPWRRLAWTFEPSALLRARLAWRLTSGRASLARLVTSPSGWAILQLDIGGPAKFFWQRIPHELGRFGWTGDLALTSPGIECSWHGRCTGRLEARWLNAASDFLPDRPLGDYVLEAQSDAGAIALNWHTLAGAVRIEGDGRLSADGAVSLVGSIAGDPALLRHLTAVAGPWVTPTGDERVWHVAFHAAGSGPVGGGRRRQ